MFPLWRLQRHKRHKRHGVLNLWKSMKNKNTKVALNQWRLSDAWDALNSVPTAVSAISAKKKVGDPSVVSKNEKIIIELVKKEVQQ